MGRILKFLIGLAVLAAILYCAYWFVMANRMKAEVQAWFDDRAEEGYAVEMAALDVGGFPGPFKVTAEDFAMGAPNGDWTMRASALEAATATPFTISDWRVEPDGDFVTEFASDEGPVTVNAANARMRVLETPEGAWRASAAADEINIESGSPMIVTEIFGTQIRAAQLLVSTDSDNADSVNVETARMIWGAADLDAAGELGANAEGYLTGELELALADPQAFLHRLVEAGVLSQQEATIATAFLAIAPKNDDGATVIPVSFHDQRTFIGPVPAGDAPRLHAPETNS